MLDLHKFDNVHLHSNDLIKDLENLLLLFVVVDDDQMHKDVEYADRSNETMEKAYIQLLTLLFEKNLQQKCFIQLML
jgi:hypothetical protein